MKINKNKKNNRNQKKKTVESRKNKTVQWQNLTPKSPPPHTSLQYKSCIRGRGAMF